MPSDKRGWIRGIGLAAAAASLTFGAPTASAREKPDLVPASAQVSGSEYRFIGNRLNTEVEFTTRNKGEKRAGPTVTRVYLKHGRDRYRFADSAVGGLEPGDTDRADDRVNGRNRFPAGGYALVVCVDAKNQESESNERNNCGKIAKKFADFYSAYHQYAGTANGTGPGHVFETSVRENWTASGVGYVWETYDGNGVFSYEAAAGGSATYTVSGTTSTNCVFSGSRALPLAGLPQSYLEVDWRQEIYGAALAPTGGYEIHSSCDPENPTTGPLTGFVFQTGEALGNVIALPFGSKTIAGSYNDPLAIDTTNYFWNLAGG